MMGKDVVVPVVLFLCVTIGITYIVRLLVNARLRIKTLQTSQSKELVESIVQGDARREQLASLRWGILSIMEAIGLGLVQLIGWTSIYLGAAAILLGAFGAGSLLYFWIGRRFG
jgi:hypothetical protein